MNTQTLQADLDPELDDDELEGEVEIKSAKPQNLYGSRPVPQTFEPGSDADSIVDPTLATTEPGKVIFKGKITVHTKLAHRLFRGRKASKAKNGGKGTQAIIGLVRFASNINSLASLVSMDDPYADQKLLQIEEALEAVTGLVSERTQALQEIVEAYDSIEDPESASLEPIRLPVEFRTPYYGYAASNLLKKFDDLVRLGLSARKMGLILDDDWTRLVTNSATKIRHVFLLSTGYHFAGANRNDFAANNPVARSAIEKYGELPQDILKGERRGRHAPHIRAGE